MSSMKYRLAELATTVEAKVVGDPDYLISSIGTLQDATEEQITFLANPRYRKYLDQTSAGAVILSPDDLEYFSGNALVVPNPYIAYAKLSQNFNRAAKPEAGVAANAVVDSSAKISKTASIGSGAVVAAGTVVGDGAIIGPNTVVGSNCIIGEDTVINANVTLYDDISIGSNCLVHSGAVIGADGFGFANESGKWIKIAQLGGVRIGNDVEIGAGTTIDRGALEDTIIEDGVILDNQIQVAHNVQIGKNSAIAGCTAIAGSTKIGAHCTIAGACGITGHLEIASGTHITAMTLVTKSITEPGAYSSGTGMLTHKTWKKNVVRFRQLNDFARRLKSLEDTVSDIKGS